MVCLVPARNCRAANNDKEKIPHEAAARIFTAGARRSWCLTFSISMTRAVKIIRRFAGTFMLASLALAWFVHPGWFLFTGFVGVNLLQSSFTNFCPLETVLSFLGVAGCVNQRP